MGRCLRNPNPNKDKWLDANMANLADLKNFCEFLFFSDYRHRPDLICPPLRC